MSIVNYYYPSTYGSVMVAPQGSGTNGTDFFKGIAQEPADSYTVIQVNSATPGVYKITLGYTGAGTGKTDTVTATKYSTKTFIEVTDGQYDFLLANKPIPANFHHHFSDTVTRLFQPNPAFTTDPTASSSADSHTAALSHSLFEGAFGGAPSGVSSLSIAAHAETAHPVLTVPAHAHA